MTIIYRSMFAANVCDHARIDMHANLGCLERGAHISSQRDVSVSEMATLLLISGEASNQSPFATSFQMM